jgi:hypothetical protein
MNLKRSAEWNVFVEITLRKFLYVMSLEKWSRNVKLIRWLTFVEWDE